MLEKKSDESSSCVWETTMLAVRETEFDWLLVDKVRLHSSVLNFYSCTLQQLLPCVENLKLKVRQPTFTCLVHAYIAMTLKPGPRCHTTLVAAFISRMLPQIDVGQGWKQAVLA